MSPDLRLNINVRNITGLDKSYDINKSVPIEHVCEFTKQNAWVK